MSLLSLLRDLPLCVVDVETTGASAAYGDRLTELGIVRLLGGTVVAEYQQLFNPQRRIGAGAAAVTGITDAMVATEPPLVDRLDEITPLLAGCVLVGHNVAFDLSFLAAEYRIAGRTIAAELGATQGLATERLATQRVATEMRAGELGGARLSGAERVNAEPDGTGGGKGAVAFAGPMVLDTVRIARRLFGRGGNGLGQLSRRLGVPPAVAHRALADAQTTAKVLEIMLAPLGGWDLPLLDVLRLQGGTIPLEASPAARGVGTGRSRPSRQVRRPWGIRANAADGAGTGAARAADDVGLLPEIATLPIELTDALAARCPVRIEYLAADDTRTQRIVQPIEVRRQKGGLMLVAHCQLRAERRMFKIDRIVRVELMQDYQA